MENKTQVVEYSITDAAIAKMSEAYLSLVITDLENKEEFDAVHSARMAVKGKRIEVDKKRKELKADALAWGKKVQDEANRIFALIEPIESHLKKEENKLVEEQKRLEAARIAAIKAKIQGFSELCVIDGPGTSEEFAALVSKLETIEIKPDEYFEFTAEATEKMSNMLADAKRALETRERLDHEEAEQKKEAERLAAERKIQAEKEAELEAAQDKIDAEARKVAKEYVELERAKKADQERRDREEFERKAKIQAEIDAKEKAMREKQEEADAEQQAKEDDLRREALRPDKEKLVAFGEFLQEDVTSKVPEVNSEEAKIAMRQAFKDIYDVGEMLLDAAEKM